MKKYRETFYDRHTSLNIMSYDTRRDVFFIFFFFLFTQYFKRVTHLAKISHSTKWPSTNILNSLKKHVIEKSKNIIYTYIHNRHTYILRNAVLSKIKRSNGIIASSE